MMFHASPRIRTRRALSALLFAAAMIAVALVGQLVRPAAAPARVAIAAPPGAIIAVSDR